MQKMARHFLFLFSLLILYQPQLVVARCKPLDAATLLKYGASARNVDGKLIFKNRAAALRALKLDADIPPSQQPFRTEVVDLLDRNKKPIFDKETGKAIKSKEYHYRTNSGEHVVIQDHSYGHEFDLTEGDQGAHFNPRPVDKFSGKMLEHGSVPGTLDHYAWELP